MLLTKEYMDVKYLRKQLPANDIKYRVEADDVSISYAFGNEKKKLTITLGYVGGVTTIELLQKSDGTRAMVDMSAD